MCSKTLQTAKVFMYLTGLSVCETFKVCKYLNLEQTKDVFFRSASTFIIYDQKPPTSIGSLWIMRKRVFPGKVTLPFKGPLLKEKICSSRSKFFALSVGPILEKLYHLGKQRGSHKGCFPF